MNLALVSILIPTYNSHRFIAQTLDSCLTQKYQNIEIIVGDDCSKDATLDIIKSYQLHNLKIIASPQNQGLTKNVNNLVRSCLGKYVIILGHDDVLPPHHVSTMVEYFNDPNVGLVHCNAMQIDAEGKKIGFVAKDSEKIRKTKNPMKWLCFNNFIQSCGLMFRKQAFLDFGGWDESFSYDSEWYTYIRYAEKYRFVYTTKTYSYYRVHNTNISKYLHTAKRAEFEAYRERCRALAMSKADLNGLDRVMIRFKVWRKTLRPAIRRLKTIFIKKD